MSAIYPSLLLTLLVIEVKSHLAIAIAAAKQKNATDGEPVVSHRAVGTAASRREINERRQREIDQQWDDEHKRVREERVQKEQEERERLVRRRNDDDAVAGARERFLARKRRKLEEGLVAPGDPPPE